MPAGAQAQSVADFYKGKNVTVIVGYTAGGGYDLYARALARHMGRHLPGNPNFIVQNITGAGSLNAANNIYNVAREGRHRVRHLRPRPRDGAADRHRARAIRCDQVHLARQRHQRDFAVRDLAHVAGQDLAGCAEDCGFAVGGEGAGSDPDTYAAFVRNVFGVKLKLVTGYHGTSDIILAIERGEVDGRCGWSWSSVKSTRPTWISEKKLNYLFHMSEVKAPELAAHSDHPRIRQRPAEADPAAGHQPSDHGPAVRGAARRARRPRGGAAPRLRRDTEGPAFLAEADKLKLEVNPVTGEEVTRLVAELYATPKDIVEEARVAIKP